MQQYRLLLWLLLAYTRYADVNVKRHTQDFPANGSIFQHDMIVRRTKPMLRGALSNTVIRPSSVCSQCRRHAAGVVQGAWPPIEKLPSWTTAWECLLPVLRMPTLFDRSNSTRTTMKQLIFPGGLTNRM